ncbi:MAG: helix-turn-helix domain-containing protein [Gemmataceae bacterium]|nr:helix-turn-helix domain-containing protein [Gemmataceae bacterium]
MARKRNDRPEGLAGQLGERIESLRKDAGLAAAELAAAAGIGSGTVIRAEAGRSSPVIENVLAIAHALGLSGAELLKGCDEWTSKPKKNTR